MAPHHSPSLQCFDCEVVDLPAGTLAVPRPEVNKRRLPIAETLVEQKVVSILLSSSENRGKSTEEHFRQLSLGRLEGEAANFTRLRGSDGWIVGLRRDQPVNLRKLSGPA